MRQLLLRDVHGVDVRHAHRVLAERRPVAVGDTGEQQPLQERVRHGGQAVEVDRRSDDERIRAVDCVEDRGETVPHGAPVLLQTYALACEAAGATPEVQVVEVEQLRLRARLCGSVQCVLHQRGGVPLLPRTSVDPYDLHDREMVSNPLKSISGMDFLGFPGINVTARCLL